MKIWCNVHDAEQSVPGVMCWKKEVRMIGALRRHCRFVEMQLVPVDARMVNGEAIVIEKVGGQWPDWAERFVAPHSLDDFLEAQEPPKDPWDYDP